ncbi:uncharacterized protein FOMMEDRAFT_161263 [Fomitiporia mediterranea MF3/22]|uniref:uncharacterized protein n=1 Tax=Fomitiporia mediterranea (strain MF3/22) TaxID=694068 RepID=UPI0004408B79|nr:uncharacterized protein FOMMEDRAFT_161263 [Fomitiporia mediterranea MF3/22]EJC99043.1 hypothetical protein FOMMEDRAFT_161263 [Fomitiporia mediterranea MF3/22]
MLDRVAADSDMHAYPFKKRNGYAQLKPDYSKTQRLGAHDSVAFRLRLLRFVQQLLGPIQPRNP